MGERKYRIAMETMVGLRYGTMRIRSFNNQLAGTLELLEHSEEFEGTVDADGNCKIYGCLVTLMRSFQYTAVGKLSDSCVELLLRGGQNNFRITGSAVPEREDEN